MDIYSFVSQPLDTICKTESAIDAGKGTKAVAQKRPRTPLGGKAFVVMGFAIVNERADALTLRQSMVEIGGNAMPVVFLEKLRVSPLHTTTGEKIFRVLPATAETFE